MQENAKEKLSEILNNLADFAADEDQEGIIETLENIPKEFWDDRSCFLSILETFFENIKSDMFVYPTEFIPDYFWDNEGNVRAYILTICEFYEDDRIDYNLVGELIPSDILDNKSIAMLLLSSNVDETLSYISNELKNDPEVILAALEGVGNKIEYREYNSSSWLRPLDPEECLKEFLDEIPKELSTNKDFVIGAYCCIQNSSYLYDYDGILANWTDKSLWSDKDFVLELVNQDIWEIVAFVSDKELVFELLSKNNDAIEYVSDELLEDADFAKKIKDELKIDF